MKRLLIVAGEDSGDLHAADVIRALKQRDPSISCFGIGGERLRAEGVELLHDTRDMDVMGFVEVLRRYPFFKRVFNELLNEVEQRRPDAALLIDYPGFNLRLARELKRRGVRVFYYISPQVWAWNRGRIPRMARIIERLMVIFPFETEVFRGSGLRTDFVGHPMVDELRAVRARPPQSLPRGEGRAIALLPGSRRQEIVHILPRLLRTAALIQQDEPGATFWIPVPARRVELVESIVNRERNRAAVPVHILPNAAREVLKQADAALVASGTATLEAALLRCPSILVYRVGWMNALLTRLLIRIPMVGIANIVMDREVMPEYLQGGMRPERLAAAIQPLLRNGPEREAMLRDFDELEKKLGDGSPAKRVADILTECIC